MILYPTREQHSPLGSGSQVTGTTRPARKGRVDVSEPVPHSISMPEKTIQGIAMMNDRLQS